MLVAQVAVNSHQERAAIRVSEPAGDGGDVDAVLDAGGGENIAEVVMRQHFESKRLARAAQRTRRFGYAENTLARGYPGTGLPGRRGIARCAFPPPADVLEQRAKRSATYARMRWPMVAVPASALRRAFRWRSMTARRSATRRFATAKLSVFKASYFCLPSIRVRQ